MQEEINFIKPISQERQKEYRYWFIISCICCVGMLLFVGALQTKQLISYWQAKQEFNSVQPADETIFKQQQELKRQLQHLQTKQRNIQQYQKELQIMQQKIARINKLQPYGQIESIHITKPKTEATLSLAGFKQVKALLQFAQEQHDFEIVHIEPKQQQYFVTVQLI